MSWGKVVLSDTLHTIGRTTPDRRVASVFPLNHPRFLEWLGPPDSAWLLEMSPGHWCDTLSKEQTMTAAMQLHRDACLMQTNLDILDQYALALHGTGVETITKYYWWGSLPWSGSGVGGTRDIRTPSLSANGSTRAVETQYGPITVRSNTIMNT